MKKFTIITLIFALVILSGFRLVEAQTEADLIGELILMRNELSAYAGGLLLQIKNKYGESKVLGEHTESSTALQEKIAELQRQVERLKSQLTKTLEPDKNINLDTALEITKFQSKYGIESTGSIGPKTQAQINILTQPLTLDHSAWHSCSASPFSRTVSVGEAVNYSVGLKSSPARAYSLYFGELPNGISAVFSEPRGLSPKTVGLSISASPGAERGSINSIIVYEVGGVKTFCQFNLIVK